MNIKQKSQERDWDNHVYSSAKIPRKEQNPGNLRSPLQGVSWSSAQDTGTSGQTPSLLLTQLRPQCLAAKGCSKRRHGRVSRQSEQTEQKWISPPEISQQIKLDLPDGKAQWWEVSNSLPRSSELSLPTGPLCCQFPHHAERWHGQFLVPATTKFGMGKWTERCPGNICASCLNSTKAQHLP